MIRSDMRTLIWGWLDDPNGGYFTSSLVNTWINLAQKNVQMILLQAGQNYYMKPVETTLVVGQSDYLLPSDFMVEHRIEVVASGTGTNENRKRIEPITTNQQDFVPISSGMPVSYYMKKDRFTLAPTPDQALTMRLYYSPFVQDLSADSDSPDIPTEYQEYVAIVAAYNGFVKDDRAPQNLQMKKLEYEKLFKEMADTRNQDQSRAVVQVTDYDGFSWV